MAAVCPACGASNRPAARFCMRCVKPLPATPANSAGDTTLFGGQPGATVGGTRFDDRANPHAQVAVAEKASPALAAFSAHALPDGTLIEGFEILRTIGEGGFGIVYLAWDSALERQVAIKEYMPSSLARRADESLAVTMRSERERETFGIGLRSFVNEARLLARFDHPALVKVFRFWEANATAYMAMPYYEGPTLKAELHAMGRLPTETELRDWLHPLLDALDAMHRENCFHRDIAPDNILLTHAGPLLLDFGAARRVITDHTQALTTMLKPGFAPIEQYGGEMAQGPWTDLYALAGVVHYAITRRPPLASISRIVNDTVKPLAQTHTGQYSESLLRTIDAALSVRPEKRPQNVAAFRAMLDGAGAHLAGAAVAVRDAAQFSDAGIGQDDSSEHDDITRLSRVRDPLGGVSTAQAARADRSLSRTQGAGAEASVEADADDASRPDVVVPMARPRASARAMEIPSTPVFRLPARAQRSKTASLAIVAVIALGIAGATGWSLLRASGDTAPMADAESAAARAVPRKLEIGHAPMVAPSAAVDNEAASSAAIATPVAPALTVRADPPIPDAATATSIDTDKTSVATPTTSVDVASPARASRPSTQSASPQPEATALATTRPSTSKPDRHTDRKAATTLASAKPSSALADASPAPRNARSEPEPTSTQVSQATPTASTARPPRCGDLVLKSSLEPLNPEEVAFLKSRCR